MTLCVYVCMQSVSNHIMLMVFCGHNSAAKSDYSTDVITLICVKNH